MMIHFSVLHNITKIYLRNVCVHNLILMKTFIVKTFTIQLQ